MMRHSVRMLALTAAAMMAVLPLAAADDLPTFDDSASSDALPSFDDGSLPSFGDDGASSDSFSMGAEASPISWSGEAGASPRLFLDSDYAAEDKPVEMDPYFRLNFNYSGSVGDVEAKIRLNQRILKDNPEDVLDELVIRAYLGDFVIEGGKMKLVWGKGDKVHVLDNFNSDDYTDFIFPDYIDRRIAIPMVHVAYNGLMSTRLEFAYAPYMVPTRYATSGVWAPMTTVWGSYNKAAGAAALFGASQGKTVNPTVNDYLKTYGAATPEEAYDMYNDMTPNTKTLKYGQFGVRATGTVGSFDWGASYYFGRRKDASIDGTQLTYLMLNTSSSALASGFAAYTGDAGRSVNDQVIDYDRLQVFGLEGATVLGGFNFRAEFAYNLTDDFDGDDPLVHNNSIAWVFGFDRDLPWNNLNLNIQTQGSYILGYGDVKDNKALGDVDYYTTDDWAVDGLQNRIVLDVTDKWMNEKLKPELKLVWNIERKDVVVMPQISYQLMDGLDVKLAGLYIYSDEDDGEFVDFKDNSFIQVGAVYQF